MLYLERGGKTLIAFTDDTVQIRHACAALATHARNGALGPLHIETVNGASILNTEVAQALSEAGFSTSPRGLRIRS